MSETSRLSRASACLPWGSRKCSGFSGGGQPVRYTSRLRIAGGFAELKNTACLRSALLMNHPVLLALAVAGDIVDHDNLLLAFRVGM